MFLKIVLLLIIIYFLYRFFGGSFSLPKPKTKEKDEVEQNTLVECASCSVYITKKEAIKKGNKYYCSECA